MIIGKSNKPRWLPDPQGKLFSTQIINHNSTIFFTDRDYDYRANPTAWMNATILQEMILSLNEKLEKEDREGILFMDGPTFHKKAIQDVGDKTPNLNFCIFPANSTSVTLPIDVGIGRSWKAKYRALLEDERFKILDDTTLEYNQIDRKMSPGRCCEMAVEAWNGVSTSTVVKAFQNAKLIEKEDAEESEVTSTEFVRALRTIEEEVGSSDTLRSLYREVEIFYKTKAYCKEAFLGNFE